MKNPLDSYNAFWEQLPTSVETNLQFAQYVIKGDAIHTSYFFGDYSKPILSWIIVHALEMNYSETIERQITGKYYDFVAGPFRENKPHWSQLRWYRGIDGNTLKSWLQRNGFQYFRRCKIKDDKEHRRMRPLLEFKGYDTLEDKVDDNGPSDEQLRRDKLLTAALEMLNERDKEVLTLMVMKKLPWQNRWEALNKYINPRGGREVIATWSNKRKQDALVALKILALEHLRNNYDVLNR